MFTRTVSGTAASGAARAMSEIDIDSRVFDTPAWITVSGWVAWLLYAVLMTARDGQTVGKKLMRTRVVTANKFAVPSIGTAAIRALPSLLGLVPVVGVASIAIYLPIAWRSDRRGLHDQLARTLVVSSDL